MSSDYRAAWLRAEQEIRDLEARVEAELASVREVTIDTDLATLRESSGMLADLAEAAGCNSVDVDETRAPLIEALARVEAELARLTARRSRYAEARYENCMEALSAAEARCARLQQALREIEQIDERDDSRPTFFGLQNAFFKAQRIAREALAGPDTPTDSQEGE